MDSRGTLVKEIRMGDCEDPYLYAAEPIYQWEQSEEAKWLKSKCDDLVFFVDSDPVTWGFKIRIYAPLTGEALTFYNLKYLGIKS